MRRGSVFALAGVGVVTLGVVLVSCTGDSTPPSSGGNAGNAGSSGTGGSQAPAATNPPATSSTPDTSSQTTSGTAPSAPAGPAGSLQGRIFAPKAKTAELVPNEKDVPTCGKEHDPGSVLVESDGSLAGAVVYLKGPKAPAGWLDKSKPIEITNRKCHFEPRISIVPIGSPVSFTNADPVLHNVKAICTQNDAMDLSIPGSGHVDHTFDKAEFVGLKCSVHPFMGGQLVVAEHPWYTLSGAKGAYTLQNVPPGTYKLFVSHETLGKAVPAGTPVTISPGQATTADVKFD